MKFSKCALKELLKKVACGLADSWKIRYSLRHVFCISLFQQKNLLAVFYKLKKGN
jgi:hypothetical protein